MRGGHTTHSVPLEVEGMREKNFLLPDSVKHSQENPCSPNIPHFCSKTKGIIMPTEVLNLFTFGKFPVSTVPDWYRSMSQDGNIIRKEGRRKRKLCSITPHTEYSSKRGLVL